MTFLIPFCLNASLAIPVILFPSVFFKANSTSLFEANLASPFLLNPEITVPLYSKSELSHFPVLLEASFIIIFNFSSAFTPFSNAITPDGNLNEALTS